MSQKLKFLVVRADDGTFEDRAHYDVSVGALEADVAIAIARELLLNEDPA